MTVDWDRYREAITLFDAGKVEEALAVLFTLEGTSSNSSDNAAIYLSIAKCLGELQRYAEARKYVAKAYEILPATSELYPYVVFIDASIEAGTGNFQRALSKLDSISQEYPAVLSDSFYVDLRIDLAGMRGIALTELKRYSEAKPLLQVAVNGGYWKEGTLFYLGVCCYELHDFTNAEQHLTESLSLKMTPGFEVIARLFLAMTYLGLRQFEAARREFEWCYEHQHEAPMSQDHLVGGLVKALEGLGLHEEAKRYSALLRVQ
jgi:tetratricopeptide (TPR) repeat protein